MQLREGVKACFSERERPFHSLQKAETQKPPLFFFDFNITISRSLIVRDLWCDIVILKYRFWIKRGAYLFLCGEKITAPQRKNIYYAEEKV